MTTELAPAEGLQYAATHVVSGMSIYIGLIHGQTVAGGQLTSASVLSGVQEENGTTYARILATLGVAVNGIMAVPSVEFNNNGNVDWHADVGAAFMATALSGGVALYYWDLGVVCDMTQINADLLTDSVFYFLQNPGGI